MCGIKPPILGRHPGFLSSAPEGVIAWGAPQAYMPEGAAFCVRALQHKFGDNWMKHFAHQDEQQRQAVWKGGSRVIERLLSGLSRLPAALYERK